MHRLLQGHSSARGIRTALQERARDLRQVSGFTQRGSPDLAGHRHQTFPTHSKQAVCSRTLTSFNCGTASHADSGCSVEVLQAVQDKLSQPKDIAPGLYLVGTPIGNLEDITLRALRVLHSVSAILAEDTRTSRKLMDHFCIRTPLLSYHAHNERSRETDILSRLRRGEALAIISDAGMPGISDPGTALVAAAAKAGIVVVPIPGPSAVLAALVGSGLPTDQFQFVGFLPPKTVARKQRLRELSGNPATLVMYVSPHALRATLEDALEVLGSQRRCCVSRELTKIHEEFWRSTLDEANTEFANRLPRGEITLIIEGYDGSNELPNQLHHSISAQDRIALLLAEGQSIKEVSKEIAKQYPSFGRRKAYKYAADLQNTRDSNSTEKIQT